MLEHESEGLNAELEGLLERIQDLRMEQGEDCGAHLVRLLDEQNDWVARIANEHVEAGILAEIVVVVDELSAARLWNFRDNRRYENAEELLKDFCDGVVHSDKYGA